MLDYTLCRASGHRYHMSPQPPNKVTSPTTHTRNHLIKVGMLPVIIVCIQHCEDRIFYKKEIRLQIKTLL